MRIAVMLRTLDEKGGIAVYSRNLVETLLDLDPANQYELLYRSPEHLGRYAGRPRSRNAWSALGALVATAFFVPYLMAVMDKMGGMGRNGPWPGGRIREKPSAIVRRHLFDELLDQGVGSHALGTGREIWDDAVAQDRQAERLDIVGRNVAAAAQGCPCLAGEDEV